MTTNPIVPDTADSYFDFDMEPESPGSPIDDGYTRLIETTVSTPNPDANAPESGFVCASPYDSASSSDVQYFDPESSDTDQRSTGMEFYDCHPVNLKKSYQNLHNKFDGSSALANVTLPVATSPSSSSCSSPATRRINGHVRLADLVDCGGDSCSESLPPSQSTTECSNSSSNLTLSKSSNSNSTLQDADVVGVELVPDDEVDCKSNNIKNFDTSKTKFIKFNGAEEEEEEIAVKELDMHEDFDQDKILQEITSKEAEEIVPVNDMPSVEDVIKIQITTEANHTSDEEEFERPPQRVRRCSSLKSGKTPPGTPGRKKIVRFADVLGLDLADVRTFLDEVPKVPMQAYDDLIYDVLSMSPNSQTPIGPTLNKVLVPLFQQPGALPAFLERVKNKQVCLENAAVTDPISLTIIGSVRVRNLDFHKSVHIRYSLDNWRSYSDMMANYVENSCDGFSDKFTFLLFGNSLQIGQRIEMAIRFQAKGQQYWDNNYGQNYCFQCLPCAIRNDPNCVPTSLTDTKIAASSSSSLPSIDAGVTIIKDAIGHTQWSNTFLY